jgi:hypothetical protein
MQTGISAAQRELAEATRRMSERDYEVGELLRRAHRIFTVSGDVRGLCRVHTQWARYAQAHGQDAAAAKSLRRAEDLAAQIRDPAISAEIDLVSALQHLNCCEYAYVRPRLERARRFYEAVGDESALVECDTIAGDFALDADWDEEAARRLYGAAYATAQRIGHRVYVEALKARLLPPV